MEKKDKNFEIALSKIRRLRLIVSLLFGTLFLIFVVGIVFKIPGMYLTFLIMGWVVIMMPFVAITGLSTCPKCHGNFFGVFFQIDKNKCVHCGLSIHGNKKN